MMLTARCPDHGPLVLDLARGRLDDEEAQRAEQVRTDCDVCGAWWAENLEGEAVATVHAAVGEVFSSFEVPRRRRSHAWWAVAAAAVVALSLGLMWQLGPSATPDHTPRTAAVEPTTSASEVISVFDFESGSLAETLRTASVVTPLPETVHVAVQDDPAQAVFIGDFESGGLAGWTPNT